jgi:hypothetical protein
MRRSILAITYRWMLAGKGGLHAAMAAMAMAAMIPCLYFYFIKGRLRLIVQA